jgi:hypothetical protein
MLAAWSLASCNTAARNAAASAPEADQVVGAELKNLYMTASSAAPQSAAQQKVILQMAEKASNGKELLLTMRASMGVFPSGGGSREPGAESRVRSIVTAKMMRLGTLDQLIEYAAEYPVDPESARPFVQRMLALGDEKSDARVWNQIRLAAFHLKVGDLERQAQTKSEQLAGK